MTDGFRPSRNSKLRNTPEPSPVDGARWIHLTRGKFALVDEADYAEMSRYSWIFHWQRYAYRAGPVLNGKKTRVRMHRQIMGETNPKILVDHRDGNGLNNRRYNLRRATQPQNQQNNRGKAGRSIGFKGIYPTGRPKKPWAAKITVNKRTINLGRFATAEEAARRYDSAAIEHFGDFACTNFPNRLGRMRTLELIEGRGEIKMSDELA